MTTTIDAAHIRSLIRERNLAALKALNLSRHQLRTIALPAARAALGECSPNRVEGLRSNWAGRSLMSRYGT